MANTRYAIPDQLTACLRPVEKYTQRFTNKVFRVRPAMVVDANFPSLATAAVKWAGQSQWTHDPATNQRIFAPTPFDVVSLPNDPITDLKILSIVHRSEGGVAVKVLTPQGWLVDLREDEFMESAITGALHDGALHGDFVWSRGGNQMRLVRVGSPTWNERSASGNGVK